MSGLIFTIIFSLIVGICTSLVQEEVSGGISKLAESLICYAASRLPAMEHERYMSEWLGVLKDCPGSISKFRFAISLYLGRGNILRETNDNLRHSQAELKTEENKEEIIVSYVKRRESVSEYGEPPEPLSLEDTNDFFLEIKYQ